METSFWTNEAIIPSSMDSNMNSDGRSSDGIGSPTAIERALPKKRVVPTACRRCHARKVKCSGGQPCKGCQQAKKESDCSYPRRQRFVKVDQDYIDRLVEENRQLRHQKIPTPSSTTDSQVSQPKKHIPTTAPSVQEPSMEEYPWFLNIHIPHTPILIGEASDCGFASRVRQALLPDNKSHIPRINYPSDEQLLSLSQGECPLPSPSRARMLLNIAFRHVSGYYCIVRKSEMVEGLKQMLQDPNSTGFFTKHRIWALLAIGELYSARSVNTGAGYPGILYFAKALKGLHIVSERPHIAAIETRLLLSFYSLGINRRHSAYVLAGSAIRFSIVMGLHLNVPTHQLGDDLIREHRNRVWWSAYTFDRMWAINLGNPIAVPEEVIDVDLPANPTPDPNVPGSDDFADADYYTARVKLAQISGRMVQAIYVRRTHKTEEEEMLSQRVQGILKDLHEWAEELPQALRMEKNSEISKLSPIVISLHLSFNQCVIVATRPILLYILRTHVASWREGNGTEPQLPASAVTLGEACSRYARQSLNLLAECWVDGSFPTFDCFYPQYLFSAGIVLGMSSLLSGSSAAADREQFESAADIVTELRDSGNLGGQEFCQHFKAMKAAMSKVPADRGTQEPASANFAESTLLGGAGGVGATSPAFLAMQQQDSLDPASMPGQTLQDLLMPPSMDLQFIDSNFFQDVSQSLYWPNITPDHLTENEWTPT